MDEAEMNACRCNPCPGSSCNCGCQSSAAQRTCACGPQCGCELHGDLPNNGQMQNNILTILVTDTTSEAASPDEPEGSGGE